MTPHRAAIVLGLLGMVFAMPARSQLQNEGMPKQACLSPAESRDLFVADKLVPPVRVMREAARAFQAEAIDIELCRPQGTLVYDVTLLGPQGRVFHRLINATNGIGLAGPPAGQDPNGAPHPAFQGTRPVPNPSPGGGLDGYFGPRFGPNMYQGPRPWPNGYPGARPGAPFFPGPRPGERGPGAME